MYNEQIRKTFFDTENPHSLVNRVWPAFIPYMQGVVDVYAHHLFGSEGKLKVFCKPDERDIRLRLNFWDEYSVATVENRVMELNRVIYGTASPEFWQRIYLTDRKRLLWLMVQPASYTSTMRMLLETGLERLREIMEMDMKDAKGKPDVRIINQIMKAYQLVDLRVKGAVLQRMQIDQRSLNYNVNESTVAQNLGIMSIEQLTEMESQLDRIEAKKSRAIKSLSSGEQRDILNLNDITVPLEIDVTREGSFGYDYKEDESEQDQIPVAEDETENTFDVTAANDDDDDEPIEPDSEDIPVDVDDAENFDTTSY